MPRSELGEADLRLRPGSLDSLPLLGPCTEHLHQVKGKIDHNFRKESGTPNPRVAGLSAAQYTHHSYSRVPSEPQGLLRPQQGRWETQPGHVSTNRKNNCNSWRKNVLRGIH